MSAPEFPDGHLYYIRFKTPKGVFYKIGVSKKSSAELRFSYGGSENYKMIDKVFMYKYSLQAYKYEQMLHSVLSRDRAYKRYGLRSLFIDPSEHPLFQDGQTELYKEDVLGFDPDYKRPFSFSNLFTSPRNNLVARRLLNMNWHSSLRDEMERRTYAVLDAFLGEQLFFSRNEFFDREGEWVLSMHRWATKNAMTASLDSDTTVHGANPLPQTKDELLALETFAPGWCYVDSIPPEIGYLKNLITIQVRSGHVTFIPDEVYSLPKLTWLDISSSGVRALSSSIAELLRLEVLDVSYCDQLEYLPPELERLPNIKEVRILREQFDKMVKYFPTKPGLLVCVDSLPMFDSDVAEELSSIVASNAEEP